MTEKTDGPGGLVELERLRFDHQVAMDMREQDRADRELELRARIAGRGQVFGLVSLFAILGTAITLGLLGQEWAAAGVGLPGVAMIVGVFVSGRLRSPEPLPGADPAGTQAP
ncbi:hypothetical protein LG943_06130 [Streptomonospora sp. S1-112]|uniref:DUF2335 domain-containing protein n=1 Tax=Streptomonospora mangrovi TaxID=2883123 RepID=A0A9X3SM10_9ACTN|nr:hypothetical protein [Streptomonospora mangrovi]MDA0563906.1 hypothetical protein [Streptomonospora mangrovi]